MRTKKYSKIIKRAPKLVHLNDVKYGVDLQGLIIYATITGKKISEFSVLERNAFFN